MQYSKFLNLVISVAIQGKLEGSTEQRPTGFVFFGKTTTPAHRLPTFRLRRRLPALSRDV